ncbi:MAG: LTA synthase family protein [Lachnospiraceae bacterium]|nr:LTA synthase family protein [Lachnospiraceae bacterium]
MREKVVNYFKDIWNTKVKRYTLLVYIFAPLVAYTIAEALNQRSVSRFFKFLTGSTITFLLNYLIVLFTVSFALILKKRIAPMLLISCVWIGFGVANFLLKSYRETPFSANDLRMATSVMGIMDKYLNGPLGILLICLIIFVIVGVIYLWRKVPVYSKKINYVWNVALIAIIGIITVSSANIGISIGSLSTKFPNLSIAYQKYGFAYCFANSVVNVGVKKPKEYSEETIEKIKKNLDNAESGAVEDAQTPNIIFLQLESFFDVNKVKDLELSEEATPIFNQLKEEFPSGYLSVNNVGYGTANTEFEMLTGMNLEDFGPGEFPYKTILKETTCESMAYVLRDYGYTSHVIHNNNASFYSRNKVFKNLGLNTFTSVEFMNPTDYTELGWVKDTILTDEIIKVLDSTDEQDFIYTISVQGHGSYPTYEVLEDPLITVSGIEDEERSYQFEYYVNQIKEMDDFVGELTDALSEYEEDVILVMYGDHLPSLELTEDELTNGNLYQTEYIIWSNFGFELPDEDLETFQIYPRIFEKLGIDEGVINKFHRIYQDDPNYLKSLKTLEYDILYGDEYVFDGKNPYVATDMQMGTYPVTIEQVTRDNNPLQFIPNSSDSSGKPTQEEAEEIDENCEYYIVKGTYFSPFCYVYINEEKCETQYIDENTLLVKTSNVQNLDSFTVKNLWKSKSIVASSEEYIYIASNVDDSIAE